MGWVEKTNQWVATSPVGRWFKLDGCGHPKERKGSYFLTEMRAGLATFFAMAYILAVNASIVSDSGGTCVCSVPVTPSSPIPCENDTQYLLCKADVKKDLVTATAAISALGTFCMGLFANLPVGIAPGMGLNAYFSYTVVGKHGSGPVPYEVALTAIFIEGFIFFGLALLGLRQWLARAIPRCIKLATSVGIGLFLTLIGLTYAEGIGLIVGGTSVPIALAGCLDELRGPDGQCPDGVKMRSPMMWIGIFCGGVFTVMLMMYRVKGAIIAGIILVSVISWPRTTPVTYFPYTELGDSNFDFFKKVVDFHPIQKVLNVLRWDISDHGGQFGLALITFLYVDILDCTGTLYSMARYADLVDPSGAGIGEGGKTGLTAMSTGLCFFISIFFAPIFASIPPWATGCVLVLVGSMMVQAVTDINWKYLGDSVPAFVTIAIMPFTYSIADGLIAGICLYILINTLVWIIEKASGGRIVPPNKDLKDPWTWRTEGGIMPPWMGRLAKGKRTFWRATPSAASVSETEGVSESIEAKTTGSDKGGMAVATGRSEKSE
ncbi:hypothetical protein C8A00DRAFT_45748 [Chaetomidium leptoderma]|uniref:Xanthine/uracil permease n=1 Tax=Chaetomidium leptoderma TaxID=669021 RepID=A0AAN6ZUV5_9PEZI|nr:hypothetical protein C8A00DRAFT_45748 [Chaetomidium leptoderma]